MSVLEAAKNKDWAAVLLRAEAGPSLTRTLQVPAPFAFFGWTVSVSLSAHLRICFGGFVGMCPHQVPEPHPSMNQSHTNQPPLLREGLGPLGPRPIPHFQGVLKAWSIEVNVSEPSPRPLAPSGGDVTEKDGFYGQWLSATSFEQSWA